MGRSAQTDRGLGVNDQPLKIRADDRGTLWLSGELDLAQEERFFEAATGYRDGRDDVVLECSGLTFLDSSGIRAIIALASGTPGSVILRNPGPSVRKVLAIVGIDGMAGIRIELAPAED